MIFLLERVYKDIVSKGGVSSSTIKIKGANAAEQWLYHRPVLNSTEVLVNY
jgi:ribosomal protein L20A (L18A)